MEILKRDSEWFYRIDDDEIFNKFSKLTQENLNTPVLSVDHGVTDSQYIFKDVVVFSVDPGIIAVMYKGIVQELGKDGRELFKQANSRYIKSNWVDKLKAVFG